MRYTDAESVDGSDGSRDITSRDHGHATVHAWPGAGHSSSLAWFTVGVARDFVSCTTGSGTLEQS